MQIRTNDNKYRGTSIRTAKRKNNSDNGRCLYEYRAIATAIGKRWHRSGNQFGSLLKKKKLNLQRPQGQYLHTPEHRPQSSEVHGHVTVYTVVTAALFVTLQAGSNGKVLARGKGCTSCRVSLPHGSPLWACTVTPRITLSGQSRPQGLPTA